MNKHSLTLLPLAACLLASCGPSSSQPDSVSSNSTSSEDKYEITTISPAGAPTLGFYDQGANASFQTDSTPSNVGKQFLTNTYDAVIFDSINALKTISSKQAPFKLARFITGGNFYVVSYGKDPSAVPTKESTFVSFGEGLLPDTVMNKLVADYEGWKQWEMPSVTYLAGVSDVMAALLAHQYDYYFIAQPALFGAKSQLGADASKVNVVANVRAAWSDFSGQSSLPQAGLFIRNTISANHPLAVEAYLNKLDSRLTVSIDDPSSAKAAMDAWNSDPTSQQAKFGFASSVAYNVQKDGANGFGMVKPGSLGSTNLAFLNSFVDLLASPSYSHFDSSLFL